MEEQETILIVDDNSTNLRVLVDYLRGCGYKTLVATSGERALTQLERNTPDLILLDVMMPGMDGPGTLQALRALPGVGSVPVAFMTAKVQPQEVDQYRSLGALDVIAKPFDPMQLPARVRDIWEAWHA